MRAAVFGAPGVIEVVDTQAPEVPPGMLCIRVQSVGICGTDLHLLHGQMGDRRGIQPGHEVGGTIETVGDGVGLDPGALVAVEPTHGCGDCHHCRGGFPNRCGALTLYGVTANGGMADYLVVPEHCVYTLPGSTGATVAAMCEPLAVCVRGYRLGGLCPGARVGIVGAGSIGLVGIIAARAMGAAAVYVTARHPHQQALARELGAAEVFADARAAVAALGETHVDFVLETVGGTADTLTESIHLARAGGTICMLGAFAGMIPIPAFQFLAKELNLVGSSCYAHDGPDPDFGLAVKLAPRYRDELAKLVTHTFAIDEVAQAFATAEDKTTGSIKVHVRP